jgi:hypothetical protein
MIELRPHHVSLFAEYFLRRPKDYYGKIQGINLGQKFLSIVYPTSEYMVNKYGVDFTLGVQRLWEKIIAEPQTEIKVVKALDTICKSGCEEYDESCNIPDEGNDLKHIENIGIFTNKIYTSESLIGIIKSEALRIKIQLLSK